MFLHTSDWLWYIGGSIFYSLTKSHLSHSRFWLQEGRNPSPNYQTNFRMKQTTYDPIHSPKKEKRSKQMCHIKFFFFFFFLNPFWGFILYLYSVKIPTACLKQFSNSVFHLADLRGVRWVILEMLIGKFPRILQPALGSGDVTGGLRGQVTAGEVVVLGGTGRDVFSRVIYPGLWRTTPKMVSGTHTIPIFLGILMGVVWEQYGAQGVLVFQAPCESTRCGWKRCYTQFPWNGHDFTMVETYDKKNPENQSKFFGIRFWGMKHKDL